MKKTVLVATLAFWCFMIGVVLAGNLISGNKEAAQSPVQIAQAPVGIQYTMKDVAQHAAAKDCWMVIAGKVYDFSSYIPQHPAAAEVMARHCGQEATRAFETKDRARPHSDYARSLLAKYQLGTLRQ